VFSDFSKNGLADAERVYGLLTVYSRLAAFLDRFYERFQLQPQRLSGGDRQRFKGDVAAADSRASEFLLLVIEREVFAGLKEAEFANTLGRNAAGG
jgi:hypothetical protein